MAAISIVNLGTDDLGRALAFYRAWLELGPEDISEGEDHAALTLENGLYLVLYPRAKIAESVGAEVRPSASEVVLSREAADETAFEAMVAGALQAGATQPRPVKDEDWGRSAYLLDPDGHAWEIVLFGAD